MMRMEFQPYEGIEPYLFVSYDRRDSERVLPILNKLQSRGYRIWYDECMESGSDWRETVTEQLEKSTAVVAFVSANSLESSICRREILSALAKHKRFLGVLLEETDMSPGMEMQLASQQSIAYYDCEDDEEFLQKFCNSRIMNSSDSVAEETNADAAEDEEAQEQVPPVIPDSEEAVDSEQTAKAAKGKQPEKSETTKRYVSPDIRGEESRGRFKKRLLCIMVLILILIIGIVAWRTAEVEHTDVSHSETGPICDILIS